MDQAYTQNLRLLMHDSKTFIQDPCGEKRPRNFLSFNK